MIAIFQETQKLIDKQRRTVDRGIKSLMADLAAENTLMADSGNARVQRLLKIYRGVRPVLVVFSSLPIVPMLWRTAIDSLIQGLDAVVAKNDTADFKAGKDLTETETP